LRSRTGNSLDESRKSDILVLQIQSSTPSTT